MSETKKGSGMKIRAKFTCDSVINTGHSRQTACFHAVYGNSGENASFSKFTPAGNIQLVIDESTAAFDAFKQGTDYYLDFTEVIEEDEN